MESPGVKVSVREDKDDLPVLRDWSLFNPRLVKGPSILRIPLTGHFKTDLNRIDKAFRGKKAKRRR